jgi:ketosteroid isomerase-like protein
MKTSQILFAALCAALTFLPAPAVANTAQSPGVMATINQFIDGFNRDDSAAAAAACAPQASIIDDFPPHEWQGPNACQDWWAALAASDRAAGDTWGHVTLGAPWHFSVTGNRAYVVLPATFVYKERGKPISQRDSVFTVALRKYDAGWRITGWAWSEH